MTTGLGVVMTLFAAVPLAASKFLVPVAGQEVELEINSDQLNRKPEQRRLVAAASVMQKTNTENSRRRLPGACSHETQDECEANPVCEWEGDECDYK